MSGYSERKRKVKLIKKFGFQINSKYKYFYICEGIRNNKKLRYNGHLNFFKKIENSEDISDFKDFISIQPEVTYWKNFILLEYIEFQDDNELPVLYKLDMHSLDLEAPYGQRSSYRI